MDRITRDRAARLAGWLYLLAIVAGFFFLDYIPDRFIKSGHPVATAHAIAADQPLFRLAIAGDLIGGVIWLAVVLALYRLLKDVDEVQAALMLILGAFMQVPLYFFNVVNYVAAFTLVTGLPTAAFSAAQRDVLALLFLKLHTAELLASLVFAGLWLFPFGLLVYKSGFLPRVLGVWLFAGGFGWLAVSLTAFLAPQYSQTVSTITSPLTMGEIAITLWLIVFGARAVRFARTAGHSGATML